MKLKILSDEIELGGSIKKMRRVMSPPLTSTKLFSFICSPSGHSVKKQTQKIHKM
jgi:hypothetical protein